MHLERALELYDSVPSAEVGDRTAKTDLLRLLAEACREHFEHERADQFINEALNLAAEETDPLAASRVFASYVALGMELRGQPESWRGGRTRRRCSRGPADGGAGQCALRAGELAPASRADGGRDRIRGTVHSGGCRRARSGHRGGVAAAPRLRAPVFRHVRRRPERLRVGDPDGPAMRQGGRGRLVRDRSGLDLHQRRGP